MRRKSERVPAARREGEDCGRISLGFLVVQWAIHICMVIYVKKKKKKKS